MPELRLVAPAVELQAAGEGGKAPRVSIVAYTGGPMHVAGWGKVVIDLKGLDASGQVALLSDHDPSLRSILGHGTATIKGSDLKVEGTIPPVTPAAQQVIELAKAGFQFQASVGVEPLKTERLEPGGKTAVNGKTIQAAQAGITVVRSGKLKEVSILALAADGGTSVHVVGNKRKGTQKMSIEDTDVEIPILEEMKFAWDKAGLTDSERVLARWNGARFTEPSIRAQTEKFLHAALAGSLDFPAFEREILKAENRDLRLAAIRAERPQAPAIHASGRDVDQVQCGAAALLMRAGFSAAAERQFSEPILTAADRLRKGSLLDLCEASLRAEGVDKPAGRESLVKAAFSTVAMPATLGLAGEKVLLDAYREAPSPWREWCQIVSVTSFREHTLLRPAFLGGFEQLAPGGTIKHGNVGEETAKIKADTYAKLLRISRTDVVNDDAGAFSQAAAAMGRAAARKLNDLVIGVLLAGSGNFFTEDRGNLLDEPLSVSAVAAAIAVLRSRVDRDGGNLDIIPRVLAVGPELESLAIAICNSDFVGVTDGSPTGNSLKGLLIPVVEPRLANATLGGSATTWAVLAAPADSPQAVAFLNGVEAPVVEALGLDADVNTLGYGWRAYFDFGSALVDYRAGVLSTGDGGE